MRGNQFTDGFKQVSNLVNNPFAQAGFQHASSMLGQKLKIDGMMGKVFNPQIREYFNVDSTIVKNKLIKILFPFKEYQFQQQIKKLDLYIPIVSFMTLIMFSTIVKGILSEDFEPNLFRKTIWILIFTVAEVLLAKGTQNSISSLNIGTLELCSLVSYRFVSLSVVVVVLVITNMSIPYLHFIGILYVFLVDTYYVVIYLDKKRNINSATMRNKSLLRKGLEVKLHSQFILLSPWQLFGSVTQFDQSERQSS